MSTLRDKIAEWLDEIMSDDLVSPDEVYKYEILAFVLEDMEEEITILKEKISEVVAV